ncbi:MAG: hypothetical protein IPJ79_08080 [Bacteroidetes bacterium]|nr:hypothetical protein [Bacteroidota bacterium]
MLTRQSAHRHLNPWDDIVDYVAGRIYYWGDANSIRRKTTKSLMEIKFC